VLLGWLAKIKGYFIRENIFSRLNGLLLAFQGWECMELRLESDRKTSLFLEKKIRQ